MQFADIGDIAIHHDLRLVEGGAPARAFLNFLGIDFRIWAQVRDKLSDRPTTLA